MTIHSGYPHRYGSDELASIDPAFIDPGSPWQNGTCESFNGRFRDELLVCEQFNTLLEVQILAEDWRIEYNTYLPHGSLDGRTPEAFRQQWINNHETLISGRPRTGVQSATTGETGSMTSPL